MESANETEEVLAAVDLGSNSFHMIIARLRDGHFQVMDRLREMVQLRAGLDSDNMLSEEAQARAIACLERFGQRIQNLPRGKVRVVGTNTLRVAENSREFLRQARRALGHPIEIVTGEEEARLIYLGVSRALAFDNQRRLVMDIGGGSTEFIIGEGLSGLMRESLEMGCVSFHQQFFADGKITQLQMQSALLASAIRLRSIQRPYQRMGWVEAVGASGTIRSVADIVTAQGWSENGVITNASLDKLIEALLAAGDEEKINLQGLSPERKNVLASGVAILKASFDRLNIERMVVSDGALREGLLYDLQGRIQHDDERDRTVQALARRYQIDEAHATRVIRMATELFEQVAADWQLSSDDHLHKLVWAAQLHEVGLAISHYQYHKHAAYLVAHSDMPGFSREEQYALSAMMRGQRRSIPKKQLQQLSEELQLPTLRLMVLLRLALVFNRGRSEQTDTYVKLAVTKKGLHLDLPEGWLNDHPLTEADLMQEKHYLKSADIRLKINT
ncbi:exopolyphosphatase [Methylophaga sp. OBS3]|uniref:exopolyphosphatase n=1 Tax=Methylophaga sp. OBS3 TaxID=2991934 RepID=UPI00225472AC|nr:exopolyphosphatase [Methylophaga sp. OBS3]MCX4189894.1 exopolyphosphatase [Methylophaga sp. OBS3]